MSNLTFAVWCPPYLEWSGGSIALHTLVKMLREEGETVQILPEHSTGNLPDNVISIYPEVVKGNPHNAKHVVRWLLNNPLTTIGEQTIYPDNELLFTFCPFYSEYYKDRILGELSVFDFRLDSYEDKGKHIAGKTCYTIRKGYYKTHDKHPADAILIRDYQEQQIGEELIKIFDECETFISYDHNCFLAVHAALRGCKSIVVPDENIPREQWRETSAFLKYGIAYGFEDLQHAMNTRHYIKPYLKDIENESRQQVRKFISITKQL